MQCSMATRTQQLPYCPICGIKTEQSSNSLCRVIHDVCGHSKCILCLLRSPQMCMLCVKYPNKELINTVQRPHDLCWNEISPTIRQHSAPASPTQYRCQNCAYATFEKFDFCKHLSSHTENLFACKECSAILSTAANFIKHHLTEHGKVLTDREKEEINYLNTSQWKSLLKTCMNTQVNHAHDKENSVDVLHGHDVRDTKVEDDEECVITDIKPAVKEAGNPPSSGADWDWLHDLINCMNVEKMESSLENTKCISKLDTINAMLLPTSPDITQIKEEKSPVKKSQFRVLSKAAMKQYSRSPRSMVTCNNCGHQNIMNGAVDNSHLWSDVKTGAAKELPFKDIMELEPVTAANVQVPTVSRKRRSGNLPRKKSNSNIRSPRVQETSIAGTTVKPKRERSRNRISCKERLHLKENWKLKHKKIQNSVVVGKFRLRVRKKSNEEKKSTENESNGNKLESTTDISQCTMRKKEKRVNEDKKDEKSAKKLKNTSDDTQPKKDDLVDSGGIPNTSIFKCIKCKYISSTKSHFWQHLNRHKKPQLKCRECEKCCYTASEITKHLSTKHGIYESRKPYYAIEHELGKESFSEYLKHISTNETKSKDIEVQVTNTSHCKESEARKSKPDAIDEAICAVLSSTIDVQDMKSEDESLHRTSSEMKNSQYTSDFKKSKEPTSRRKTVNKHENILNNTTQKRSIVSRPRKRPTQENDNSSKLVNQIGGLISENLSNKQTSSKEYCNADNDSDIPPKKSRSLSPIELSSLSLSADSNRDIKKAFEPVKVLNKKQKVISRSTESLPDIASEPVVVATNCIESSFKPPSPPSYSQTSIASNRRRSRSTSRSSSSSTDSDTLKCKPVAVRLERIVIPETKPSESYRVLSDAALSQTESDKKLNLNISNKVEADKRSDGDNGDKPESCNIDKMNTGDSKYLTNETNEVSVLGINEHIDKTVSKVQIVDISERTRVDIKINQTSDDCTEDDQHISSNSHKVNQENIIAISQSNIDSTIASYTFEKHGEDVDSTTISATCILEKHGDEQILVIDSSTHNTVLNITSNVSDDTFSSTTKVNCSKNTDVGDQVDMEHEENSNKEMDDDTCTIPNVLNHTAHEEMHSSNDEQVSELRPAREDENFKNKVSSEITDDNESVSIHDATDSIEEPEMQQEIQGVNEREDVKESMCNMQDVKETQDVKDFITIDTVKEDSITSSVIRESICENVHIDDEHKHNSTHIKIHNLNATLDTDTNTNTNIKDNDNFNSDNVISASYTSKTKNNDAFDEKNVLDANESNSDNILVYGTGATVCNHKNTITVDINTKDGASTNNQEIQAGGNNDTLDSSTDCTDSDSCYNIIDETALVSCDSNSKVDSRDGLLPSTI